MRRLLDWVKIRMRFVVFAPLVLFLAVAAYLSAPDPTSTVIVPCLAAGALLLVLQFRLWDDLEDREHDAVTHPDRVIVRSPPGVFRVALVVLGVVNLAILAATGAWTALVVLAALDVAFVVAYRVRAGLPDGVWRYSILLAKYPAFVAVLAFAQQIEVSGLRLCVAALLIYVATCFYEALHDRPLRPGVNS